MRDTQSAVWLQWLPLTSRYETHRASCLALSFNYRYDCTAIEIRNSARVCFRHQGLCGSQCSIAECTSSCWIACHATLQISRTILRRQLGKSDSTSYTNLFNSHFLSTDRLHRKKSLVFGWTCSRTSRAVIPVLRREAQPSYQCWIKYFNHILVTLKLRISSPTSAIQNSDFTIKHRQLSWSIGMYLLS